MEHNPFRYFYIKRTGAGSDLTQATERQFYEEHGKYLEQESELKRKYSIVRYFIFKNHTRYVKACQKLIDADFKNSLDMLATFTTDNLPDGFTTIDLGEGKDKAQEELRGLNMFKIDLRTKKGRKIFDEFFEMRNGETGEDKQLGEYVVNNFGLYHVLVPYNVGEIKEVYSTIITQRPDIWLVACPRHLQTIMGKPKGLSEDYIAELPVVEISKEEYINKLSSRSEEIANISKAEGTSVVKGNTAAAATTVKQAEKFACTLTDSIMKNITKKKSSSTRRKLKFWEIHQTLLFGDEAFE